MVVTEILNSCYRAGNPFIADGAGKSQEPSIIKPLNARRNLPQRHTPAEFGSNMFIAREFMRLPSSAKYCLPRSI
jgi:hypothetical protein